MVVSATSCWFCSDINSNSSVSSDPFVTASVVISIFWVTTLSNSLAVTASSVVSLLVSIKSIEFDSFSSVSVGGDPKSRDVRVD